MTRSIIKKQ